MYKTHHVRTSFLSLDVGICYATVARSAFARQNVQSTPCSDHFLKFGCCKNGTLLWREANFLVKLHKTHHIRFLQFGCGKMARPLWCEAYFQVKMYKTQHVRSTVARSIFASQNAQSTPCSDYFLRFGYGKMARRCAHGAKHICKLKCTKHTMFGPLFEVGMLENATPLWREAHLQVKMHKMSGPIFKFGCGNMLRRCGAKHICKSKCTKHTMFGPFFEVWMWENGTLLWCEANLQVKLHKTHHIRFLKFRCGKMARPCGVKYIFKSKCTKYSMSGPLWRKVHLQVKMRKVHHVRTTF